MKTRGKERPQLGLLCITASDVKEATVLINAARRGSTYDPEAAARALLEHTDPRALVNSNADEVEQLRFAARRR